jgi:hypothetical protein
LVDVTVHHSLAELDPLREELAALNRASRWRSPFSTLEFFENYVEHDEFFPGGGGLEVWFLTASKSGRIIGYLPLRRVFEQFLGVKSPKLEFLATHDIVRPHLVCRPEDESCCAEAFYKHLLSRSSDWSMLEFKQQDETSPLFPLPVGVGRRSHYQRQFESMSVNVIPNEGYSDVQAYLQALDKKFRANTRRQLRNLLAAGEASYLFTSDSQALPLMLELYLDVERRCWKAHCNGTIGRDPRRIDFYRGMLDAQMPMRMGIGLVVLDGVPIAGAIVNGYQRRLHAVQIAFDSAHSRLSPGSMLFTMMMKETIDGGWECLDLMSGFSYYKTNWRSQTTECQSVQVFHVGSLLFYKALLGELRRKIKARLVPRPDLAAGTEARRQLQDQGHDPATIDRRFLDALLATVATKGVRRYTAAELVSCLGLGARPPRTTTENPSVA